MENEFIITPEMVEHMNKGLKQAKEFKDGMKERLEIATKKYNSLIGGLKQKTGYNFDFERFVGFISYHKIDWKPLNTASFELLLHEFYKEEINISGSYFDSNTPIDEQRILEIERMGKNILEINQKKTRPPQAGVTGYKSIYSDTQLENIHGNFIGIYLDENTKLEHFKKAFNGEPFGGDFEPLKWILPTMGAVLFFYLSRKKPKWTKYSYLFEPANYKKLLSHSRRNGTFEHLISIIHKTIL